MCLGGGDVEEMGLIQSEHSSTQKALMAQIDLNKALRDQIELMEIDDRQNMLITQNLKESNKELWNRLTSMPQDIMNLNNQLDDAKQEISDLKEYISNLN